MTFVKAIIMACAINGGQCEQQTVMIERSACKTFYHGQVAVNGKWVDAIFRIACQ